MSVFVVTNGVLFLTWDDKGALATGHPDWVPLDHARQYHTLPTAERAAKDALSNSVTGRIWTQKVDLILGDKVEFVPAERDPEYAEFKRLEEKFKNR